MITQPVLIFRGGDFIKIYPILFFIVLLGRDVIAASIPGVELALKNDSTTQVLARNTSTVILDFQKRPGKDENLSEREVQFRRREQIRQLMLNQYRKSARFAISTNKIPLPL